MMMIGLLCTVVVLYFEVRECSAVNDTADFFIIYSIRDNTEYIKTG